MAGAAKRRDRSVKEGGETEMKPRVLYILERYPQLSETYILNEVENVREKYDIEIFTLRQAPLPYENHQPYHLADGKTEEVLDNLRELFRPDIVHFHYIHIARMFLPFCQHYGIPFTVRMHSFDALRNIGGGRQRNIESLARYADMVNSELCLGVLSFPCTIDNLVAAGMRREKLLPSFPVVNVAAFFDRAPNGGDILNVGAALGKKAMGDFMRLAKLVPDLTFNLYAIGYNIDDLRAENAQTGGRCNIFDAVQPEEMPRIYKRHRWLVYTASIVSRNVGWPMAVAEAQAAGVGVCIANVRPDLKDYLGPGGGILFDDVSELTDILHQEVPEEMRERGFEQCWKSDISKNILQLTNLWDSLEVRAA